MPDPLGHVVGSDELIGGRFQLTGLAGEGAYSTVYSGTDVESGARVAVKALPSRTDGASGRDHLRLERELKVGRSLDSPYVADIYGWRIDPDDVSFIVMEYVQGRTLAEVIDSHGSFPPNVALETMRQIAVGLRDAHEAGVIHRDLKPENVMVVGEPGTAESIKIVDFGLAKLHTQLCDTSIVEVTRQGRAVGTPRYIAPEQARGREVGPWSDLYALGLIFYELLTGEQAVQPDDVDGALKMHIDPGPLPLPLLERMPRGCGQLVRRLTAHDPDNRYRDAGHLVSDIETYLAERTGESVAVAASASASRKESAREPDIGRRVTSWSWLRPRGGWQWVETMIALLVTVATFVVVTAHFPEASPWVRAGIGFTPAALALVGALATEDHRWRKSPVRRANLYGLGAFALAHVFVDTAWFVEMRTGADWFLRSIDHLPGVGALAAMIRVAASAWAQLWISWV